MVYFDELVAPWARWYADSTAVSNAVVIVHLAGLLLGGGRAVTADLLLLGSHGPDRYLNRPGVEFLAASHRQVLAGLAAIVVSGLLMVLADRAHYFDSAVYWVKMAAVGLLLLNGARLTRLYREVKDEALLRSRWGRIRTSARVSLVLWFGVVGLGVWLGS